MGHTRLGDLPRTRKWGQVVGLIAGGAGSAQVANATIRAAETGLNLATEDKALVDAVWLLTQLPLAAKQKDFVAALKSVGVHVSREPGLMELVGAVSDAIDSRLPNNKGRTDLGEMAQMAVSETLARVIGEKTGTLYGVEPADVQRALASAGTVKQFGELARHFFGRLTNRCLDYFVSRAVSLHLGEGERFPTLAAQSQFNSALEVHCHEASKIVETFSGEWFSKTNWEKKGIGRQEAAGFTHVAMGKLVSELKAGAR